MPFEPPAFERLDRHGGEWLRGVGPEADIVISSRVRLARNLGGFPFLTRASDEQRREVIARVRPALAGLASAPGLLWVELTQADEITGALLMERHLISRELQGGKGPRGVAFGANEAISVMVNEEDHLRLQAMRSALALDEAWHAALALDQELEGHLEFAADPHWGYLTACPTNVGTGLRASVMLHLPALVQMKQVEQLFQSASRTGLAVRGFFGEGTMASGDLYQVSNQVTLGKSEEEILASLKGMLPNMLAYERRCREELARPKRRLRLEDRCYRALATLKAARILTTEEAMQLLSIVRLGTVTGVLSGLSLPRLNELLVLLQPAHVQALRRRALSGEERDVQRAQLVREALAEVP